ncbi:MAG: hypothetical protein ACRC80_03005 [Waterburya sp.]
MVLQARVNTDTPQKLKQMANVVQIDLAKYILETENVIIKQELPRLLPFAFVQEQQDRCN